MVRIHLFRQTLFCKIIRFDLPQRVLSACQRFGNEFPRSFSFAIRNRRFESIKHWLWNLRFIILVQGFPAKVYLYSAFSGPSRSLVIRFSDRSRLQIEFVRSNDSQIECALYDFIPSANHFQLNHYFRFATARSWRLVSLFPDRSRLQFEIVDSKELNIEFEMHFFIFDPSISYKSITFNVPQQVL